ncbi:MAG: phosphatase, partial [Erysipelotrichaceae bacterium]
MNPEGDIDVDDESLSVVDYAIASIHSPVFGYQNIEATTQAYLRALRHPIVRVLGHIDDGKHMCDYRQVIEACVQNHVLIEVNNSSLKPDAFRLNAKENIKEILAICKELKCPIIMNSDAHFCLDVGNIEHSIEAITLANFPNELIVNYNEELLKEYFNV